MFEAVGTEDFRFLPIYEKVSLFMFSVSFAVAAADTK
jgi:hypothetical protein